MRLKPLLIFCLLGVLILPVEAGGEERAGRGVVSLYWENDFFAGTDQNYTNGVKLTWTAPWLSWRSPEDGPYNDS